MSSMAPLGALSLAWTQAEASRPLDWTISGIYHFGDEWIALAEGPEFEDYLSGCGEYADQALRRLSDRLQERRGPTTGLGFASLPQGGNSCSGISLSSRSR